MLVSFALFINYFSMMGYVIGSGVKLIDVSSFCAYAEPEKAGRGRSVFLVGHKLISRYPDPIIIISIIE